MPAPSPFGRGSSPSLTRSPFGRGSSPSLARRARLALAFSLTAAACGPGPDASRAKPAAPSASSAPPNIATLGASALPNVATLDAPASPPAIASSATPPPPKRTGATHVLRPASAPFAAHPEVLVHVPEGVRADQPLGLALFLHGWFGCVDVVAYDEGAPCRPGVGPTRIPIGVVGAFERARVNALLVLPQLAFDTSSSDGGRLERKGGLRALVAEVLASAELSQALGPGRRPDDLARVLVFAHSGAYDPLSAILAQGGLEVHEVHLLDALYQLPPPIEQWARASTRPLASGAPARHRLSIIYTDREKTGPRSLAFFRQLAASLPSGPRSASFLESLSGAPPAEADVTHPFLLVRTMVTHEDVPRTFLGPLLRSAGLFALPEAPRGNGS
ncbi:MAG: hypothetical protein MUF34_10400 [Polyangiaceae bacterium]|nr:hypothetical protein [Polyangiaceae bacterium]